MFGVSVDLFYSFFFSQNYRYLENKIKQYRVMPSRKTHTLRKLFEAWSERIPLVHT